MHKLSDKSFSRIAQMGQEEEEGIFNYSYNLTEYAQKIGDLLNSHWQDLAEDEKDYILKTLRSLLKELQTFSQELSKGLNDY